MSKKLKRPEQPTQFRIRVPKQGEVLGVLEQRLGASRTRVRCFDGVTRICRIPGRLKRYLWVREGDILLIEPWKDSTEKGDIIFKYNPNQVTWLKDKGFIKEIDSAQEFQEF
ncbi:translation initiation factor eIF-1A [Candidatus Woesearchaeota archaeon]|nr:translation initiation factor eIF-1A [Candidatus Woesearchaeota archaeon]